MDETPLIKDFSIKEDETARQMCRYAIEKTINEWAGISFGSFDELKQDIFWFIYHFRHVDLGEINERYGLGTDTWKEKSKPHIYWKNMRSEVIDALNEMIEGDILSIEPCPVEVYALGGTLLDCPIIDDECDSEKEGWIPIVLNIKGEYLELIRS